MELHRALVVILAVGAAASAPAPVSAGQQTRGPGPVLFADDFSSVQASARQWQFHNRAGSFADGQLWIDGDYTPDSVERDGWALTQ